MQQKLLQIFLILNSVSPNNYLVGGCVRDELLGEEIKDMDIVTDIHLDISKPLFEAAGWAVKEVGEAFLILNLHKDGFQFEIATFRSENFMKKPKKVKRIS